MYRAHLIVIAAALVLSGCEASLARLPGERFESHTPFLLPDDPLSLGQFVQPPLSTTDEPADAADTSPVAASTAARDLFDVNAVNAPLGALLHALATEAGIELQLQGKLDERVTLRLEQRSLPVLIDALAQQTEFAWTLQDKRLQVHNGRAYAFTYPVDYLNMDRRTESSVGLATQVGTINASDSSAHSIANSSQTRLENSSEHRFWDSLHSDIERLVSQQTGDAAPARYTINREAGLLNLHAVPPVHRIIQRYLEQLHDSAGRQVLIEATVVEVTLSDSFDAGVDWQLLANSVNGVSAVQALTGAPLVNAESLGRVVPPAGMISLVQQGRHADVGATLSLLEQFGDVRILSRPRIIALNNQSSVLKVVDNRVYFTVNIERRQSETRDEIVTETEIHTVPVGLVMNVTPQISSNGAVMLNVRPTLSRILGFVNDPNPELAEANVRNGVPEIQVREMESMLKVQSGNMAIIGGLMQETSENSNSGLPALGRVPLVRQLFSQRSRNRRQTELLIVLRPTVIATDSRVLARR
ncbi:pilus (MSHA type) biogenesis protein MshL [Granulosicoccus sp. 3-233]|uniref:pilus (MSHA type) biogenesis protein MshL n=1 Tax=Granulosicoccus sp. 3-233 TaxID=3417969 RepID=UPI003D32A831